MHLCADLDKGLKPTAVGLLILEYDISQEYGYMFWGPFSRPSLFVSKYVCILWIVCIHLYCLLVDMAKSNHDRNNKIVTL